MGTEIERKFLVSGQGWRDAVREARPMRQGYLVAERARSVRIRVVGSDATLTIKGETQGATRPEFEFPIPLDDAARILETLCLRPLVEKTRHLVEHAGHQWELDVFSGANAGLVVAELELESEDEDFEKPPWLGDEVTDDPRYYNASLARRPYREWLDR